MFQECPSFLLPLPRDAGFEFYFCQWLDARCGFTSLLEYKVGLCCHITQHHILSHQTHGENAPTSLMMSFYTELKASKGWIETTKSNITPQHDRHRTHARRGDRQAGTSSPHHPLAF